MPQHEASPEDRYLRPTEVAKLIGVSRTTLWLWREKGRGPTYFRFGESTIRYKSSDVTAWVSGSQFSSTTAEAVAK